jgi:hypothetical protein
MTFMTLKIQSTGNPEFCRSIDFYHRPEQHQQYNAASHLVASASPSTFRRAVEIHWLKVCEMGRRRGAERDDGIL